MKNTTASVAPNQVNSSVQRSGTNLLRSKVAGLALMGILAGVTPPGGAKAGSISYTEGMPVLLVGNGTLVPAGINTEISDGNNTLGFANSTFLGVNGIEGRTSDFFMELIDSSTGELAEFGIDFVNSQYFGQVDGFDAYLLRTESGNTMSFYVNSATSEIFTQSSDFIPLYKVTSAVPEPGSLALLTTGLLGVFASLKKRGAKTKK